VQTLQRTPLYERHVAAGARMVPFAGWEMPVQYDGVIPEHRAVRADCGVFDVSHMGEIEVEGPKAHEFLQWVLANGLGKIDAGGAQYTLLTNERGGIVDDLIAYRQDDFRYLLVVNASNRIAAFEWLKEREIRGSDVRDVSDEYALLAVQGPRTFERLGLRDAPAFTFSETELGGIESMVARTGYTGERGVEILVMAEDAEPMWDYVVEQGAKPCGLGARDTLRLEVCYPLHGNDITPDTDAISAGLGWVCALDKDFTGVAELRRINADGPQRRLVAFVVDDRAVPRQGMPIAELRRIKEEGPARRLVAFVMVDRAIPRQGMTIAAPAGEVTSGSLSPMLEVGIGMGYVPAEHAAPDTMLTIDVRGRPRSARTVQKPIYKREESA
jgi:aminomethyltransferase